MKKQAFIFTVITTANSIYYTYYSSFASFSMLSLTQFIAPVGDAVVQNVLQIKDLVYLIPTGVFYIYVILQRKNYIVLDAEFELLQSDKTSVLKQIQSCKILAVDDDFV